MNFWEKVKKDIQIGVKEGLAMVKEGATVVKEKAEELTEEGKRRYKLFELKTRVQRELSELGGKVYDLSSKIKNPMHDKKVNAIIARVKRLETQISKLEGNKVAPGKATKHTTKSKGK